MVRLPLQASSKPLLCGGLHQSLLPLWERHWWMAKKTPGEWVADMHGSILYSSILICSRQEEISEGKGYVWFVCCLIYRIECYWRQYDVVFICSLSFAKVFDTLSLTIMILKLHQTLIGLLLGTLSLTTMILKLSQTPIGLLLGIWSLMHSPDRADVRRRWWYAWCNTSDVMCTTWRGECRGYKMTIVCLLFDCKWKLAMTSWLMGQHHTTKKLMMNYWLIGACAYHLQQQKYMCLLCMRLLSDISMRLLMVIIITCYFANRWSCKQ